MLELAAQLDDQTMEELSALGEAAYEKDSSRLVASPGRESRAERVLEDGAQVRESEEEADVLVVVVLLQPHEAQGPEEALPVDDDAPGQLGREHLLVGGKRQLGLHQAFGVGLVVAKMAEKHKGQNSVETLWRHALGRPPAPACCRCTR